MKKTVLPQRHTDCGPLSVWYISPEKRVPYQKHTMEIHRKINGRHVKTSLIYFGEFLDTPWNSIKKFEEFLDFDNDNGAIWRCVDENWRVLFAEIAMGGIGNMQPLSASYREAVSGR